MNVDGMLSWASASSVDKTLRAAQHHGLHGIPAASVAASQWRNRASRPRRPAMLPYTRRMQTDGVPLWILRDGRPRLSSASWAATTACRAQADPERQTIRSTLVYRVSDLIVYDL